MTQKLLNAALGFIGQKFDALINSFEHANQRIRVDVGGAWSEATERFSEDSRKFLAILPQIIASNNGELKKEIAAFAKSLGSVASSIESSVNRTMPVNQNLAETMRMSARSFDGQAERIDKIPTAIERQTSELTKNLSQSAKETLAALKDLAVSIDTKPEADLAPLQKTLANIQKALEKEKPENNKDIIAELKELGKTFSANSNKTPQYIIGGGGSATQLSSTVDNGAKSVDTSAVQLSTSTYKAKNGVVVKAAPSNTGIVYVGDSDAVTANSSDTTDGFPLSASESITIPVDKPSRIYIIGSDSSQKVFFLCQ